MLALDHVSRSFGKVAAVRDVSFTVASGAVFGLLGPNGAGKTTTMRMILGIYPQDAGTITWHGEKIDAKLRLRFGYLPEERGLYGRVAVRDQIIYFARLHGLHLGEAERRADEWLKVLNIEEYAKRPSGELSKGNQQKVQMACAAAHGPELLILDEPFSGLDPVNAEAMVEAIGTLAARGTTLILSSHQMWQIEQVCSEFCIIAAGQVRTRGSLAELRDAFPTRTVRVAPDTPEIRAVFDGAGVPVPPSLEGPRDGEAAFSVPADADFGRLLRAAAAAGPLTTFDRVEPSLNDIYLRAIGATPQPSAA
jgi:ABC-2 type transport system ATP-binding protein